MVIGFVDVTMF